MKTLNIVSGMTAVAVGMFVAATAFAVEVINPVGTWRMENGKVTVEVSYCGEPNVCVTIVGLAKPLNKQGKPKFDKNNPDPKLRARPLIGLQIINGMVPDGDLRWVGKIYNADDGKLYRSTAVMSGDTLLVKGHWGPFSKKMNFIRVK
jgi:uncharacterized protein (DUF2147 family)